MSYSVMLSDQRRDRLPLRFAVLMSSRWRGVLPTVRKPHTARISRSRGDRVIGGNIIVSDHEPGDQSPHESQHPPGRPPNVDAVHIPAPRSPLDDLCDTAGPPSPDQPHRQGCVRPENGLVEPEFRYDQTWKRRKHRHYNGFVERVGGMEGKRLRENLAAAIRDLLDWAAQHTETQITRDDNRGSGSSDGESGTDSNEDGGTR